ncbi:hypothetical protein TNCT_622381 [Trichonephila clavata]|uniref:Uncharacterized protein n=1 Tax=Trichonephila clavata TaxID=2740835 RepID=A0A8X6GFV5_TRICU|nr:hypothetical protein TNCT_622381 [Trichonephila clavata]
METFPADSGRVDGPAEDVPAEEYIYGGVVKNRLRLLSGWMPGEGRRRSAHGGIGRAGASVLDSIYIHKRQQRKSIFRSLSTPRSPFHPLPAHPPVLQ